MLKKITIVGDGAMGSVCAMLLCENGIGTTLWGYDAAQLAEVAAKRENVRFLPGYPLPEQLCYQADDAKALGEAELVVSAIPCQFMRGIWTRLKPFLPAGVPVVSTTKGVEIKTLLRPTEILAQILGASHVLGVLSGPTIADELARKLPATATVACADMDMGQQIQQAFTTPMFRVYTNEDVIGVELAGAMKNVIAIAAGIIDGIGAGDNAKAALITLGDLVTTCISPKGRNRSFGERIGRGLSAKDALAATQSVVEGATTCESVLGLAAKYQVEMPIAEAVFAVISGRKSVRQAIAELMSRQLKAE
jgi:glycerol-3-phosphate dehydrogenase (NAD(P)+)